MRQSPSVTARLTRRRSPWLALAVGAVIGASAAGVALWVTAPPAQHGPGMELDVDPVVIPGTVPLLPDGTEVVEVPADESDPLRAFTDCTSAYLAANGYDDVTRTQGIDSPAARRLIDDAQLSCGAVAPDG